MANPFEDPDVKAVAGSGNTDATGGNVYGGGNAYGDANDQPKPAPTLNQAQQDLAISVGTTVAKEATSQAVTAVQNDYAEAQKQQGDAYSRPDAPDWCTKCMNWLPIRYIAWIGGLFLLVSPILDWVFTSPSFVFVIVGIYLFVFGIMIVFIESPSFALTRRPQLAIYFWLRLLSRMWGRSAFYFFISFLCFAEIDANGKFKVTLLAGIYLLVTATFMLIISFQSATKYRRIFDFIAAGTDPLNQDELVGKLTRKFDELDMDADQKIGSQEVVRMAEQAGRNLSNAERYAIQTFLDASCNGAVLRDDFVNQFMNHNIKQKWL